MYDARPAAIEKRLDETAKKSREVFKKAHKEDLEDRVRSHFDRYFSDRERALTAGVKLLESPKPPKDHQEDWSDHFTDFGSKAAEGIADLVKDAKIKTPFVTAVSVIAAQEAAFFAGVARMPMARTQGEILQWYGQYVREKKALRDDWKKIQGDGRDLSEDMVEVMKEINEIFEAAIKKASEKARDAEEVLARWVPTFEKAENVAGAAEPGPVGTALEMLGHALEALKNMRPSTETLAGRFRALYKSHEVVTIQLFGKTRGKVGEFIGKVNLEAAVEEFEAASENCVRMAKDLEPPGQADDAEDLVDAMMDEAHETLEQFEAFFKDFVDEFREIFLGPVGGRTVEDLVGRKLAIRESDHFQRLNIQSELKKIQAAAKNDLDLPLGRLPDDKREQLEEWVERDLETLSLAVREAIDFTGSERIRMIMQLAFPEREKKVKQLPGASV